MSLTIGSGARRCAASLLANEKVSSGLIRLDLDCGGALGFAPGQFAMLNLAGAAELVFSRPFSILAVDGTTVSFLYRVVGRGTALLAEARPGDTIVLLGPLGRPFPAPDSDAPRLLLAGGVGLPPLYAWWRSHARPQDLAFFGGRDGEDVPWELLPAEWGVSVDHHRGVPAGREAFTGLVIDLAQEQVAGKPNEDWVLLSCGPLPLLKAAAAWAADSSWPCLVSVEEHMGCGYGVCKGCVVPLLPTGTADGPDHATSCQEGPVFPAERIDWSRFGA